jgi:hypothetical protein
VSTSPRLIVSRVVWTLTGGVWAARSLVEFADPDYWDPVTTLDWTAVWLFSAALLGMAASVLLLGRLAPSRGVTIVARLVALAAVAAGVANGVEDGLGASAFGTVYIIGFLTMWLGLLALAVSFGVAGQPRLSGLSVALFLGVMLFMVGGGVVTLFALGSLAVAPAWFVKERTSQVHGSAGAARDAS